MRIENKLFLPERNKGLLGLGMEGLEDLTQKINESIPAENIVSIETVNKDNKLAGLRVWYRK